VQLIQTLGKIPSQGSHLFFTAKLQLSTVIKLSCILIKPFRVFSANIREHLEVKGSKK
jgi:hypothetical protein